jgi:hypothetical protein
VTVKRIVFESKLAGALKHWQACCMEVERAKVAPASPDVLAVYHAANNWASMACLLQTNWASLAASKEVQPAFSETSSWEATVTRSCAEVEGTADSAW